jgi:hypothetical protein
MSGTLVVSIHPPSGMSSEDFLQKLKDDVFPLVEKGPTRVGEIESWSLLQRVKDTGAPVEHAAYIWLINWGGLPTTPVLAKSALAKLRTLGASVHETNYSIADEFSREKIP